MYRMSIFVLVNNSSIVNDVTPVKMFLTRELAIQALYDYEMKSVFKPVIMYEYTLKDGVADMPTCWYKIKRSNKGIVEGHERIPVNQKEYLKRHPFLFDKLESMFDASTQNERAL